MKKVALQFILAVTFIPLLSTSLFSQDLTGIWKGYFLSSNGEYYKLEFQVNQNTSLGVTGVSYSYLDVRFYGKATMTGSFNKTSQNFRIREIKTVELKSMNGQGACIMNYDLHYAKSGREEFLEGQYLGKTEVKNGPNPFKWGQCGSGKVYLRRVAASDFYVEPFLRRKIKRQEPVLVNKDPVQKNTKPPVKKTNPVVITKPPIKKQVINPKQTDRVNVDSVKKITTPPPVVKQKLKLPVPPDIKNRSNELAKVITVKDPAVVIKIYDNGEIDGDTISVYLDNKKMLSSQVLAATPLVLKFNMEDENEEHELVMVAENLGRIPPNTSLMVVESGGQRFEVRISSTEQKNAVVRFRYQKP